MRLIHLSGFHPEHAGSFVPVVQAILAEAGERGWSTDAVFPAEARGRAWLDELAESGCGVRLAPAGGRRALTRWLSDVLAEQSGPCVLHTHFTTFDMPAWSAARRRDRTLVFWHIHSVLSSKPNVVLSNALRFGLFGHRVERILCPAANIAEGIARRLGPRDRIEIFPSPIDVTAFPIASAEQRTAARKRLELPEEARVLLHFGRDWSLKGGDLFLRSVRRLLDDGALGPVVALVHHGGAEARADAESLGLGDAVRLVGMVDRVQSLFAAADVFVAPSRGEGMPFSVVECLASGTPVVASDLAGHRFLANHVGACRITGRDPDEIAAAVTAVLNRDPVLAAAEQRAARDWIASNLELRLSAARMVDAYVEALG